MQPFLIRHLKSSGFADTIKSAKKMLERGGVLVDQCLDIIADEHLVLVQRFPTYGLGRLRAFRVKVTEDRAVHLPVGVWDLLHLGSDPDDATVQVHLVLTREACAEAEALLVRGSREGPGTAPPAAPAPPGRRPVAGPTGWRASRSSGGSGGLAACPASSSSQVRLFRQCRWLRRIVRHRDGLLVRIHGLARELVALFGETRFVEDDCGDSEGLRIHVRIVSRLGGPGSAHLEGRVILGEEGGDDGEAPSLAETGPGSGGGGRRPREVRIRSPLMCRSTGGVCRRCYGSTDAGRPGLEGHLGLRTVFALIEPLFVTAHHLMPEDGPALARHGWYRRDVIPDDAEKEALEILGRIRALLALLRGTEPRIAARLAPAGGLVYSVREMKRLWAVDLAMEDGGLLRVNIPRSRSLLVEPGKRVRRGQPLCTGAVALRDVVEARSLRSAAWSFLLRVMGLYRALNVDLDPRHVELAARRFLGFRKVSVPGGSSLLPESVIPQEAARLVTEACRRAGDPPPTFQPVYLSTRKMLACVESPLVRAAYLDAREVLIWAAVRGEADELRHPLARAMTGRR